MAVSGGMLGGPVSQSMKRGHFASLQCACGHEVILHLPDLPPGLLDPTGWTLTDAALARLRCSVCGRVGRPAEIRCGWSHGGG